MLHHGQEYQHKANRLTFMPVPSYNNYFFLFIYGYENDNVWYSWGSLCHSDIIRWAINSRVSYVADSMLISGVNELLMYKLLCGLYLKGWVVCSILGRGGL